MTGLTILYQELQERETSLLKKIKSHDGLKQNPILDSILIKQRARLYEIISVSVRVQELLLKEI